MAEYAISTNLISWVPAKRGLFGWPADGQEAEVVEEMRPGDLLIPKFSQTPDYRRSGGHQTDYVKAICRLLDLDYEAELADYEERVAWGAGAVPFLWRVAESLGSDDRFPSEEPWSLVAIEQTPFELPFSTSEFLRLRAIPIEIARQFKATAAQGRHIQRLPDGTAGEMLRFSSRGRDDEALRKLLLVKANASAALGAMRRAGLVPRDGDYLFLVGEDFMPGFRRVQMDKGGGLVLRIEGEQVAQSPQELLDLFERATERALPSDDFRPGNARRAAQQLAEFAASDRDVLALEEFGSFYDRYVNLPQKVSQALAIAERDVPPRPRPAETPPLDEEGEGEEGEDGEQLEQDRLNGLTVAAIEKHLEGIVLPASVLAETVTAIRAGKHLLLCGPPGTGKSVVAAALCRAVVDGEFRTATATADWTTFDTIGGYMPQAGGGLEFEPGIVLRCLEPGRWLIVDELNRADIDKAFGPLFTLLSSSGEANGSEDVTLPFRKAEKSIRIVSAESRAGASSPYAVTPTWRLIGTLNVRDKASLFQLSFAFMRRFAVVDVPLPARADYEELFAGWIQKVAEGPRGELVEAAMRLAFGPRQLGPAILKDVAAFVDIGMTTTQAASVSSVYGDPVEAFLTAVRLYAAPQYEGASPEDVQDLLRRLRGVWSEPPAEAWAALERALGEVGLG